MRVSSTSNTNYIKSRNDYKPHYMYVYMITLDGVTQRREFPNKLNYANTIANLRKAGYKEIHFDYKGAYTW